MALVHESTTKSVGYIVGDIKIANYDISFTVNALIEPESGWFLLNGAVLSQTTYPKLYAQFGTTFNTGSEGTGNFRLPNWTEGIFPVGKGITNFSHYAGSASLTYNGLAYAGGEISHTLVATELPAHVHGSAPGSGLTLSANSHGHSYSASALSTTHTHTYTETTVAAGPVSGANSGGFATTTGSTSSGGSAHTHPASVSGNVSGSTTESFTKSGSTASAGSGGSHNNMMPYVVIGGILVKHD